MSKERNQARGLDNPAASGARADSPQGAANGAAACGIPRQRRRAGFLNAIRITDER
jgi:hypothetical protein